MSIPSYEQNPHWMPRSVSEAVELAADHRSHGIDPDTISSTYGKYAYLTADLPWVGGGFESADLSETSSRPVDLALKRGDVVEWGSDVEGYGLVLEVNEATQQATVRVLALNPQGLLTATGERKTMKDLDVLSPSSKRVAPDVLAEWPNATRPTGPADTSAEFLDLEREWKDILGEDFHRQPREETDKSADLGDDDLFRLQKGLAGMSHFEFAAHLRELGARRPVDLSDEASIDDEGLWQHYQDVKSGEAGRRRAGRAVEDKFEERLSYWREAAKRGEPLPRDIEGLI